jgi:erythromycin esterase
VVALGEAAHGTREFFHFKHRLFEYLVSELGFSVFALEAALGEDYLPVGFLFHHGAF